MKTCSAVLISPYQSVDEFVARPIAMLHEPETWLAEHRTEIEAQIAEGYAAAQRGELIEPAEAPSRLDQLKRSRLDEVALPPFCKEL